MPSRAGAPWTSSPSGCSAARFRWKSWPSTPTPPGSRTAACPAAFSGGRGRRRALAEQRAGEVPPATDTDLVEDRLEVVLHGVVGDVQGIDDLARGGAAEDQRR